mmetsp:Transcript_6925/g.8534  ORF Transcript_6925/g.8534 Transcript_6925/m.8534 type:complete len:104 (+) Transcript_6925:245-556(+)|eukprot:CAMPEP_0194376188 /NCGR_PEP_ID=MMETSP0174-20130528/24651_1 /TAXON_ID=216777 /ORGANISM="Proboscia alata, Strain PI-D3" /LENGTH=103 /DNA_ID=CAMNT_0039156761 /DNA_START=6 /DNA_END=317 /DNA_ORIENTATION=-
MKDLSQRLTTDTTFQEFKQVIFLGLFQRLTNADSEPYNILKKETDDVSDLRVEEDYHDADDDTSDNFAVETNEEAFQEDEDETMLDLLHQLTNSVAFVTNKRR